MKCRVKEIEVVPAPKGESVMTIVLESTWAKQRSQPAREETKRWAEWLKAGEVINVEVQACGPSSSSLPRAVVIESPFLGGQPWAILYARLALREQLKMGNVPFASHLLYTQALDDAEPAARKAGMSAGWAPYRLFGAQAEVYIDFGISAGMAEGIAAARRLGCPVVARTFGPKVCDEITANATAGDLNPARLGDPSSSVVKGSLL